ncbi:hypothetical protein RUM44_002334 [Polyplax serrata]|uniref:Uncharacterized protein n=1 Tax=Polyplax serrata TaxID=468196 RepID=A0ABR1ANA4_POLSC
MTQVLTGLVKYAPRITAARKTKKYSNFCVVMRKARRTEGLFILWYSAAMHIINWIMHTKARMKKTVANPT